MCEFASCLCPFTSVSTLTLTHLVSWTNLRGSVVSVRVRQEMTSVPTFNKYETNVQLIFVHQGVHHNLFSSRSQNGVSSFPQYTELHDEHLWIGIVRLYANQDPAHAFPHSLVRSCVVRTLVLLLVYLRSLLDSCLLDFSLDCWI